MIFVKNFLINLSEVIFLRFRSIIKWLLRWLTGLCELQRNCYDIKFGYKRAKSVERSLRLSKNIQIRNLIRFLDNCADNLELTSSRMPEIISECIKIIGKVKKIDIIQNQTFSVPLYLSITQIWSYKQLLVELDTLRSIKYDSENESHEKKLLDLWSNLMTEIELDSRISPKWQLIGFQGEDPKTDFRGMGILSLENLLFFVTQKKQHCEEAFKHARHAVSGYTFAIVGINLTKMTYDYFMQNKAQRYIFNHLQVPDITSFHLFYCYLFFEFDKHWVYCNPKSIMDFPYVHQSFKKIIDEKLQKDNETFELCDEF